MAADKQRPRNPGRTGKAVGTGWQRFAERQRLRMASVEALPQMAFLGIASGLLAGLVIILFRWTIESAQVQLLPGAAVGAFETLPPALRL